MQVGTYSISLVAEITGSQKLSTPYPDAVIVHLLTDSRKISIAETSLFFAIKGERHNGNQFIAGLYAKGVRNFILSEEQSFESFKDANFLLIDNALDALQRLTAFHRSRFNYDVIAITGSNGKTIVKEWLYQLLREDHNIVRSPKSYNSQIGVPLSVWQMGEDHTLGIFEAGISKPGEMERLKKILNPSIGIFTNIGHSHDEHFKNRKEKLIEKLNLFSDTDLIIYCKDYLDLDQELFSQFSENKTKLLRWSRKSKAELQVGKISRNGNQTEIQAIYLNEFIRINIPFLDEASIENSITCWLFLLSRGMKNELIAERMLLLAPVAMRLELKDGINNCSIINDSYNSDLGSLSIALDFLNHQHQHEKKSLIISDILQSGRTEESLYSEVAELIEKKGVKRLIGIGAGISRQAHKFSVFQKEFYEDTEDFISKLNSNVFRDETILLKGARTFGFEEISKLLQHKAHSTVLEINLNALIHNYNYYRSKIKPSVKIMTMVKAFSYGSGSFEIANILQFNRADYLAVAYADEGIELRKAGITLPIMVMNPEEQSYDAMIQFNLEPEIYSFRVLNLFDEAVKRNVRDLSKKIPIHIKLDTGMHRLGFEKDDVNELIVRIKNNRNLKIESVFSHLVGSEDPLHDVFTKTQISNFREMSEVIIAHFDYTILRHILNSAGITRFTDAEFDMVRLGIGLYGISSNEFEQMNLQNVSTLKTTISQIKNVGMNETIGYNRKGVANSNIQIATIPIGYADGLSRKLSNGIGQVWINGKFAPFIGNICMDMCMIDITDVKAREGDEVIIFGEPLSISEIAKTLQTIPYEVLTNVSRRVKRVYYQE